MESIQNKICMTSGSWIKCTKSNFETILSNKETIQESHRSKTQFIPKKVFAFLNRDKIIL